MRTNTRERTIQRRTILYTMLSELEHLVELYGTKSLTGWKPKSNQQPRLWIESNRVALGYADTLSWKLIWPVLHRDYIAIQKGWKPPNQ